MGCSTANLLMCVCVLVWTLERFPYKTNPERKHLYFMRFFLHVVPSIACTQELFSINVIQY